MRFFNLNKRGFTIIELLVVISIIGLLSSVVLASLSSARSKARDSQRIQSLRQLAHAAELHFSSLSSYPGSAGWFTNSGHGGLDAALTPTYISKITDDPGATPFMYWRKDFLGYTCLTMGDVNRFGFYARLENPSTSDPNYISPSVGDSFDRCVATTWTMNYKAGN